jgi:hypothetical protein
MKCTELAGRPGRDPTPARRHRRDRKRGRERSGQAQRSQALRAPRRPDPRTAPYPTGPETGTRSAAGPPGREEADLIRREELPQNSLPRVDHIPDSRYRSLKNLGLISYLCDLSSGRGRTGSLYRESPEFLYAPAASACPSEAQDGPRLGGGLVRQAPDTMPAPLTRSRVGGGPARTHAPTRRARRRVAHLPGPRHRKSPVRAAPPAQFGGRK